MLKTVKLSQANKTAGCAVTYRTGKANKYDTCPAKCELNASGRGCAPSAVDAEYLDAVLDSKPRSGHAFIGRINYTRKKPSLITAPQI